MNASIPDPLPKSTTRSPATSGLGKLELRDTARINGERRTVTEDNEM